MRAGINFIINIKCVKKDQKSNLKTQSGHEKQQLEDKFADIIKRNSKNIIMFKWSRKCHKTLFMKIESLYKTFL